MQLAGGDYHIIGVSLRSASVANQLNPQDGLYTIVEQGSEGTKTTISSAISEVIVAPNAPSKVLDAMCQPNIHIVSLTITEKGYCHDPASGKLNLHHKDIAHDLSHLEAPRTAIGFLVGAMQRRIALQLAPMSIISCDNLPDNGHLLKQMVLTFAQKIDHKLALRIESEYTFPCTMVDRIVPATTEQDIAKFSAQLGYIDEAMVVTEPFTQWVIEDKFAGLRPAWEHAGALITDDVRAFETMKLRLLNGSHSSIAYLGFLANKKYVADVMSVEVLAAFVDYIMHKEILPSVEVPTGIDISHYCQQLLKRFANPNLHHQTYQIAMDGSQKLPQRLLNPLRHQLETGGSVIGICMVVAAWMQYASGFDLNKQAIEVQDPMARELAQITKHALTSESWVTEMLELDAIFGEDLKHHTHLVQTLTTCLEQLRADANIEQTLNNFMDTRK
jgi:fructuronate reductase